MPDSRSRPLAYGTARHTLRTLLSCVLVETGHLTKRHAVYPPGTSFFVDR